jgi:hypothetical protein
MKKQPSLSGFVEGYFNGRKSLMNENIPRMLPIEPVRSDWKFSDEGQESLYRKFVFEDVLDLKGFVSAVIDKGHSAGVNQSILIDGLTVTVKVDPSHKSSKETAKKMHTSNIDRILREMEPLWKTS